MLFFPICFRFLIVEIYWTRTACEIVSTVCKMGRCQTWGRAEYLSKCQYCGISAKYQKIVYWDKYSPLTWGSTGLQCVFDLSSQCAIIPRHYLYQLASLDIVKIRQLSSGKVKRYLTFFFQVFNPTNNILKKFPSQRASMTSDRSFQSFNYSLTSFPWHFSFYKLKFVLRKSARSPCL